MPSLQTGFIWDICAGPVHCCLPWGCSSPAHTLVCRPSVQEKNMVSSVSSYSFRCNHQTIMHVSSSNHRLSVIWGLPWHKWGPGGWPGLGHSPNVRNFSFGLHWSQFYKQELHRVLAATAGAACSGILSHPSISQADILGWISYSHFDFVWLRKALSPKVRHGPNLGFPLISLKGMTQISPICITKQRLRRRHVCREILSVKPMAAFFKPAKKSTARVAIAASTAALNFDSCAKCGKFGFWTCCVSNCHRFFFPTGSRPMPICHLSWLLHSLHSLHHSTVAQSWTPLGAWPWQAHGRIGNVPQRFSKVGGGCSHDVS